MSRLVVVVLAILGIRSASSSGLFSFQLPQEACADFLEDDEFDSRALGGSWTVVYSWPAPKVRSKVIMNYIPLSPKQVTAYENEMSTSFPDVSWENVKYEMNFNDVNKNNEKVSILLEILDDTGYVNAIPSGKLYSLEKTQSNIIETMHFAYKLVGDYLAVKICDDVPFDGLLFHKGTDHDAADVGRVASGISDAMSSKSKGGVAAFLNP